MLTKKKIGFIGGGALAEALIQGMLQSELVAPSQITVCDVSAERMEYLNNHFGVVVLKDSLDIAKESDILFLTVKPQIIAGVVDAIAQVVTKNTVIVTVAAGISLSSIEIKMPQVPVIRVMPNTPVAVGAGMSALVLGKNATQELSAPIIRIFESVGKVVLVNEDAMDAVTGLSGSGPAYGFVLIDALSDAGVRVGLPRQTSLILAAQTLLGAAKMVLETGEHPAKLRDMVTSPGGTTIAGVHILEKNGVRAALIDAVVGATERSRELGKSK